MRWPRRPRTRPGWALALVLALGLAGFISWAAWPRSIAVAPPAPNEATTIFIEERTREDDFERLTGRFNVEISPWPTGGLTARPRFSYEDPDAAPVDAWWVRIAFHDGAETPEGLRSARDLNAAMQRGGPCNRVNVIEAGSQPVIDCLVRADGEHSVTRVNEAAVQRLNVRPTRSLWERITGRDSPSSFHGPGISVLGPGELR